MDLYDQIGAVRTRNDFVAFVKAMLRQYLDHPQEWGRNQDIESFLSALKSSAVSIDRLYLNRDEDFPQVPSWKLFAEILWMAADYE